MITTPISPRKFPVGHTISGPRHDGSYARATVTEVGVLEGFGTMIFAKGADGHTQVWDPDSVQAVERPKPTGVSLVKTGV